MSAPAAGSATVLVVEDDYMQRLVTARALSVAGYSTVTAANAEEGLLAAERCHPALIISDYYMPGMDGFAFCRAIRAHPVLADTMFIIQTTAVELERKIEALDTGADDYLTKPVNIGELRSRVRALLRSRHLNEDLKRERSEMARLNETVTHEFEGVLSLLNHLIGHRVPGALERGERAAALGRFIASRLDMAEAEIGLIELAGRIHEIGKVDLPDALLRRPEADLDAEERNRLTQFPVIGSSLVERIPQLEAVASWIRHQLENYDGTGLPDHLEGAQIPTGARILRVVNLVESAEAQGHHGAELVQVVEVAQRTVLGPRMGRLAIEYFDSLDPDRAAGKRQVSLGDLAPGMVIAVDICSARGTKLLPKDSTLTRTMIERIKNFNEADPILGAIYVHVGPPVAAAAPAGGGANR